MRELDKELKELRLYGMAGAWEDLVKQGGHACEGTLGLRNPGKAEKRWENLGKAARLCGF